jgi:hypothetical protein
MASTDALVLGDHGIEIAAVSAERGPMGPGFQPLGGVGADLLVGGRPHRWSAEFYIFLDRMREPQHSNFERHLCPEIRVVFQAPGIQRLAHGLLDLALCGDANNFQELPNGNVELIFVHLCPSAPFAG